MLLINFFKKASVSSSVFEGRKELMLFLFSRMSRFFICIVFSLLLNSFSLAQNNSQNFKFSKEDSAKIVQLKNDLKSASKNQRLNILYQLGLLYVDHDDVQATSYAVQLLEESKLKKEENQLGLAYYLKGKAIASTFNVKALDYFKLATVISENHNNGLLKDLYFEQANIHTIFSEFPEALKYGLKSLEYNKINNIEKNVQRDMSFIGYIYDRMYEFKEAIKWNRDALKLAKNLKDKNAEALCYGRIGIAFDELAEKDNFNKRLFDSALFYNQKAAKLNLQNNDLSFLRRTYSNIGNTYSKLKDYKKAEEFTLKSLEVPGFEENKGVTLVNLGKIYLETNRYQEAKKMLDSAMQNTLTYGTRKYQLEAYFRYHELNVKKGDYKSALKNYIDYKGIEDSLLNETKTKQIAEVSERYKTADKEREILIQRADLAEKNLTIQEQNLQVLGLLALAIVLTLIGFLFYNQQKLKNKQLYKENELKDALIKIETQNKLQEQRLRISRDLHDNIGAQLTFIISSIDNLKYGFEIEDEKLRRKLDGISEFTSSTIYELRDTIWAMNKNEITFEDLQTRISNYIDKAHVFEDKINFTYNVAKNVDLNRKFSSVEGMNIHRVIQESIHNSLKHAKPSQIHVEVAQNLHNLQIIISDNGSGFDIKSSVKGNGLINMQKRINEIGGELEIISKPKNGTQVVITL